MRHRALALTTLLLVTAGCTSFQQGRPLEAVPLPAPVRDRFEVWTHGNAHQLHALHLEGDSLVGVPWWKPPECDSCRVALLRTEVDSVRVRRYDGNETGALASVGIPFIVIPGLAMLAFLILGLGPSD